MLATRTPAEFNLPDLASVIQIGCSPRATLGLVAAARALALIHGRDYVLPTDVQSVAKDVMAHRSCSASTRSPTTSSPPR